MSFRSRIFYLQRAVTAQRLLRFILSRPNLGHPVTPGCSAPSQFLFFVIFASRNRSFCRIPCDSDKVIRKKRRVRLCRQTAVAKRTTNSPEKSDKKPSGLFGISTYICDNFTDFSGLHIPAELRLRLPGSFPSYHGTDRTRIHAIRATEWRRICGFPQFPTI